MFISSLHLRRMTQASVKYLKYILAFTVAACTWSLAQRTGPLRLTWTDLHRGVLHVLNLCTGKADAVLVLQFAHLTRVVTAMTAGLGLGLSGAAWQTLRRTPVACMQLTALPLAATLGAVAGHAGLEHAALQALAAPVAQAFPVLTSVLGALALASYLTWATPRQAARAAALARMPTTGGRETFATLLLMGALSTWLLHSFIPSQPKGALFWLSGSFTESHNAPWTAALVSIALGVAILTFVSRAMAQLLAGDRWAACNGVDVTTTKSLALLGICLLLGAAVNLAGNTLGVGLVAVVLARALVGDMPRLLWPTAGVLGAIAALWIDALARASGDAQELPIGIVGAAVAAMSLLWTPGRTPESES